MAFEAVLLVILVLTNGDVWGAATRAVMEKACTIYSISSAHMVFLNEPYFLKAFFITMV